MSYNSLASRTRKRKAQDRGEQPPEPVPLFEPANKKSKKQYLQDLQGPPAAIPIDAAAAAAIELEQAAAELRKEAYRLEIAAIQASQLGKMKDGQWYKDALGRPGQYEQPAPVSFSKSTGQRNLEAAKKQNTYTGPGSYYTGTGGYKNLMKRMMRK